MTREECEKLIAEKLHEIAEIYLQYNPAGKYLSLTFQVNKADETNHHYQFNNEYWRIVGVFETEDESGNVDRRIKIVRNN